MASNSMRSNIPLTLEEETLYIKEWETLHPMSCIRERAFWKHEEEKLFKNALATFDVSNSMRSEDSLTLAEDSLFERTFVKNIHKDLPDILHNVARAVGNKSVQEVRQHCEARFVPLLRAWARYRVSNPPRADVSWTLGEDKVFEILLRKYGKDTPDRWENVAREVGSKSVEEVRRYYEIQVRNAIFLDRYFMERYVMERYVIEHPGKTH